MNPNRSPQYPDAHDAFIRNWRQTYYDPSHLDTSTGTLGILLATLDELVSSSEFGRSYVSDGNCAHHHYTRAFREPIAGRPYTAIFTEVQISSMYHRPTNPVREEVDVCLEYREVAEARPIYSRAYQITRFAGGVASMWVHDTFDGFATAFKLRPTPAHTVPTWLAGTEYDATLLFDTVQHLQTLKPDSPIEAAYE